MDNDLFDAYPGSLLKLKQGDSTTAFLHAYLEEGEGYAFRFLKERESIEAQDDSLWQSSSPCAFYMYLIEKLEACGMSQSQPNLCFFIREKAICLCYVDDLQFWFKNETYINKLIILLCHSGVNLD